MFLGLDSYEFPMRNYGDIAFRVYGSTFRYVVNLLQSVQLLCATGLIIISNGQALSQVSKFKLCYAVCCLIWAVVGFGVGQVRTLQKYGWLANAAVWINLMIMFISMGTHYLRLTLAYTNSTRCHCSFTTQLCNFYPRKCWFSSQPVYHHSRSKDRRVPTSHPLQFSSEPR